jgi:hypothetical protein
MALPTTYSTGTATVNAAETAVTGQGTTWLTSGLQAGDLFWAGGMSVRIASVNSNTSLTLAFPWPDATRTAQQYEVRFTPDATRVLASARAVLDALAGGELKAIGDLNSSADTIAYFTGAGTAALTALTPAARSLLDDLTPAAMRATLGVTSEYGVNANGAYVRLPDGTQLAWGTQFVNAQVAPGISFTYLPIQPAAFVGIPVTIGKVLFFTGPDTSGSELYGAPFSTLGANLLLALQTGRSPSAEYPSFTIGGNVAQSVVAHYASIGRWL